MDKGIGNANAVAYKLRPALTRAINHKLEVVSEERQKREPMIKRRKTEAMAIKCQRTRGGISLSNEEKENYESDIKDKINPD